MLPIIPPGYGYDINLIPLATQKLNQHPVVQETAGDSI